MVEAITVYLEPFGWTVIPEHSFSHYGERGSIDILAWHGSTGTLLVIEVKSRLYDLQDTLSTLDRKRRLTPTLARRTFDWQPRFTGVLLVMPNTRAHRRTVTRHEATFRAALPSRQVAVRRWLEQPQEDLRGVWFLNIAHDLSTRQRSRRKRACPRRTWAMERVDSVDLERRKTGSGRRDGVGFANSTPERE
jgi:hypothetical protein